VGDGFWVAGAATRIGDISVAESVMVLEYWKLCLDEGLVEVRRRCWALLTVAVVSVVSSLVVLGYRAC